MLDLQKIERLYEFGALIVYEIKYFDSIMFETKIDLRTFSEEKADSRLKELRDIGLTAAKFSYFVKFDDAYSK